MTEDVAGFRLTLLPDGRARLARGAVCADVDAAAPVDLAAAISAGMTRPPEDHAVAATLGDFAADRVWLAQLAEVATHDERCALLRAADKMWLSVVFLLMQDHPGFLAAFRDSLSARAWPILFEDCRLLAQGAVRASTVRQGVENVRAQCLKLQFQGLFRRKRGWLGGAVPVIDFGEPRPIPADPDPPYDAHIGAASFTPLERKHYPRTCRLTLGPTVFDDVPLADAFRLRTQIPALGALADGPAAFRRAWVAGGVRELADLSVGALAEWRRGLEPLEAAAAVVWADGTDFPRRLTAPLTPMAVAAVTARVERLQTDEATAVAAGAAALERLWRLAADGCCEIFPGGGLLGFEVPTKERWFAPAAEDAE